MHNGYTTVDIWNEGKIFSETVFAHKNSIFYRIFDRSKYEPCLKSISQSTDVVNFVFPRLTFFKLKKIQIKITVDLSNRVGSWKS